MKYNYELGKEATILLLIMIGFMFLCLLGLIGYQIYTYVRDNKIKKVKAAKGKKITLETYNELQKDNIERIKLLENRLEVSENERDSLFHLLLLIKEKEINLNELERLGLQKYNARYGKIEKFSNKFITDFEYELLKKYHYIDCYHYSAWRKIPYENNK